MGHSHHHHHNQYNKAFAIGIGLNIAFVIIEFSYGLIANSLALIADAGHNLSDVLSLLLAWGASFLATTKPSSTRTYGLKRTTILASLLSSILLLIALGGISWEAFERLFAPSPTQGVTVIVVALIGVAINTFTALLFVADHKKDLNIRAAYLHMAADAGISAGVAVAGIIILWTGWLWLDPALSLVIVVVICFGTWELLRDSLNLTVDAVPNDIKLQDVETYLNSLEWVNGSHDLHIWALSTTETACTVHLVSNEGVIDNARLAKVQNYLHDKFDIEHTTIQVEYSDGSADCLLDRPQCH